MEASSFEKSHGSFSLLFLFFTIRALIQVVESKGQVGSAFASEAHYIPPSFLFPAQVDKVAYRTESTTYPRSNEKLSLIHI